MNFKNPTFQSKIASKTPKIICDEKASPFFFQALNGKSFDESNANSHESLNNIPIF